MSSLTESLPSSTESLPSALEFEKALLLVSRHNGITGSVTVACQLYENNMRLQKEIENLKEIIKIQSFLLGTNE